MLRDMLKGTPVYTDIREEYISSILMIETAGVFHKIFFTSYRQLHQQSTYERINSYYTMLTDVTSRDFTLLFLQSLILCFCFPYTA